MKIKRGDHLMLAGGMVELEMAGRGKHVLPCVDGKPEPHSIRTFGPVQTDIDQATHGMSTDALSEMRAGSVMVDRLTR